jgi:hypothetical protein
MKTTLPLLAAAAISFPTLAVAEKIQMRDAATHEELTLALRKADQNDPMKEFKKHEGEDPSVVNRPKDLLSTSDIISFNGMATLVPKRAILQTPKNLTDRIKLQPGVKIVSWLDFYTANRGWITTIEVSRVQAEGNKPLEEETKEHMSKSTNLVVATYQGGPISVLPLKQPEDAEKTISSETATTKP